MKKMKHLETYVVLVAFVVLRPVRTLHDHQFAVLIVLAALLPNLNIISNKKYMKNQLEAVLKSNSSGAGCSSDAL